MDAKSTIKINSIAINLGYYCCTSPLRWDSKTKKVVRHESKCHRAVRGLLMTVFTMLEIALAMKFLLDKSIIPFDMRRPTDIWRLGLLATYGFTTAVHWNTLIWQNQLKELMNDLNFYVKLVEGLEYIYCIDPKVKSKASIVTSALIVLIFGLLIGVTLMYVEVCQLHFTAQLFPICQPGNKSHGSVGWVILMALFQIFFGLYFLSGLFLGIAIGSTIIMGGPSILETIRLVKETAYAESLSQRLEFWSHHYRCIQILLNKLNVALAPVLPSVFCYLMAFHTLLLYSFIMIPDPFPVKILNVVAQLIAVCCYYFIPHMSYKFCKGVNNLLVSELRNFEGKWYLYHAFAPVSIRVGDFDSVNRLTLLLMLETVFMNTINFVLMDFSV